MNQQIRHVYVNYTNVFYEIIRDAKEQKEYLSARLYASGKLNGYYETGIAKQIY